MKLKYLLVLTFLWLSRPLNAQVAVHLNGIHCFSETEDGSGSDEIFMIVNSFCDGQYKGTMKVPGRSYMGGIDAGGTYFKDEIPMYLGSSGLIVLDLYLYEWDNEDPDKIKLRFEGAYEKLLSKGLPVLEKVDVPANSIEIQKLPFDKLNTADPLAPLIAEMSSKNDLFGRYRIIIQPSLANAAVNLQEVLPKINNDRFIDQIPYHKVLRMKKDQGDYGVYLSVDPQTPGINQIPMRKKWDQFKWLGSPTSIGSTWDSDNKTYVTDFVEAKMFGYNNAAYVVQGDILKTFMSQKTGKLFRLGLPITDERNLADFKFVGSSANSWMDAGYVKISKFQKGVIIWKPGKTTVLSNEEYEKGPIDFKKVDSKELVGTPLNPKATNGNLSNSEIDQLILRKGKEAKLGAIHSEAPAPRPTAGVGGRFLRFEKGWVYYNPSVQQAFVVSGVFMTVWAAEGYETGSLGFPLSDNMSDQNFKEFNQVQHFDKASIYVGPNGTKIIKGTINTKGK
ncbi:MAG: hypothetical protein K2P88_03835 [Chitinophagaceae bacterium]|uniref:LGFP repeat-containing protein n=1 Tax=unclassified Paraflavitalea TaxID=2798305 RepID=UPI003D3569A9|nr:hypothetical protein [Chitinophagaceae bacterium]